MIGALFGFQGRLARLAFLGWNLAAMALVAAIALAYLALGTGLSGLLSGIRGAPTFFGAATGLTCAAAGIWMTLALTTKRVRDIGLAPLPLVVAATAVLMVDHYSLTRLTELRFFPPFANYTPLGGLLAFTWLVLLICWPGKTMPESDDSQARDRDPVPGTGPGQVQLGQRK
jgi:uncharacterized membrane protein YhaH (DUF805 family)